MAQCLVTKIVTVSSQGCQCNGKPEYFTTINTTKQSLLVFASDLFRLIPATVADDPLLRWAASWGIFRDWGRVE